MTYRNYGKDYTIERKIVGICSGCNQRFFLHNGLTPIHYQAIQYENRWSSASEPLSYIKPCIGSEKLANGLFYG